MPRPVSMSDPATRLGTATDDGEPKRIAGTILESVGLCELLALKPVVLASEDLDNSPILGGGGKSRGGGRLDNARGGSRVVGFSSRSFIGTDVVSGGTPGNRSLPSISPGQKT